jgi:ribosomal protein L37AE/L43A
MDTTAIGNTDKGKMSCPYCGRPEVERSRRRWWERLMPGLRRIYRCGSCGQRFRRPASSEVPPRYDKW